MDLPNDPSAWSSQLSDSFALLSSQPDVAVNTQSFAVYCEEEGAYGLKCGLKCRGVRKNLKSLRGSERDDNEVLLQNRSFASAYGVLLDEEEKTVKRSDGSVLN